MYDTNFQNFLLQFEYTNIAATIKLIQYGINQMVATMLCFFYPKCNKKVWKLVWYTASL